MLERGRERMAEAGLDPQAVLSSLDVLCALSHLRELDREALVDHEICGRSWEDIGRRQGCTRECSRRRAVRALGQMERLLADRALHKAA